MSTILKICVINRTYDGISKHRPTLQRPRENDRRCYSAITTIITKLQLFRLVAFQVRLDDRLLRKFHHIVHVGDVPLAIFYIHRPLKNHVSVIMPSFFSLRQTKSNFRNSGQRLSLMKDLPNPRASMASFLFFRCLRPIKTLSLMVLVSNSIMAMVLFCSRWHLSRSVC